MYPIIFRASFLKNIRTKSLLRFAHGEEQKFAERVSRPTFRERAMSLGQNACRIGTGMFAAKMGVVYGMCYSVDKKMRSPPTDEDLATFYSYLLTASTIVGLLFVLPFLIIILFYVAVYKLLIHVAEKSCDCEKCRRKRMQFLYVA